MGDKGEPNKWGATFPCLQPKESFSIGPFARYVSPGRLMVDPMGLLFMPEDSPAGLFLIQWPVPGRELRLDRERVEQVTAGNNVLWQGSVTVKMVSPETSHYFRLGKHRAEFLEACRRFGLPVAERRRRDWRGAGRQRRTTEHEDEQEHEHER